MAHQVLISRVLIGKLISCKSQDVNEHFELFFIEFHYLFVM
jgi:hypothetical protein